MAEYASNAKGNLGVTLGAIGSGLSLLGNHSGLFGGYGNGYGAGYGTYPGLQFATKESVDSAIMLAHKDAEIALLKSEQNTEVKIADVYERLAEKINRNKDIQDAINTNQAVYNGANNANIGYLRNQIDELTRMTRTVIPADHICPRPMDRYNSWVAPVTSDTAATPAT